MDLTRKEYALRGADAPQVLSQFLAVADVKLNELRMNAKVAQVNRFRTNFFEFFGTVLCIFRKLFVIASNITAKRRKVRRRTHFLRF